MSGNHCCNTRNFERKTLWGVRIDYIHLSKDAGVIKLFHKITNGLLPDYPNSYLNFASQQNHPLRSVKASKIRFVSKRAKSIKKSFSLTVSNLKADIRNAKSISMFKKLIVSKKHENSLFSVYDPLGEKFLTRLRLKFSHLKEHKLKHGFADTINPMCACGPDFETTEHFLLRCHFHSTQDLNPSIILRNLTLTLKIWVLKTKSHLCYSAQKQILLKILIKMLSRL